MEFFLTHFTTMALTRSLEVCGGLYLRPYQAQRALFASSFQVVVALSSASALGGVCRSFVFGVQGLSEGSFERFLGNSSFKRCWGSLKGLLRGLRVFQDVWAGFRELLGGFISLLYKAESFWAFRTPSSTDCSSRRSLKLCPSHLKYVNRTLEPGFLILNKQGVRKENKKVPRNTGTNTRPRPRSRRGNKK